MLQAIHLAEVCGAQLEFIYVVNINGAIGGYPLTVNQAFPYSVLEGVISVGEKVLEHALDLVPDHITAKGRCLSGVPGDTILSAAQEIGADLIVMGSRGYGVIKGALLGSVSRFLTENAKCPVMIVKANG